MKKGDTVSWVLYGLGLAIVFLTHIYMLVAGLPESQMVGHAIANLVAGVLLAAGWLKAMKMKK